MNIETDTTSVGFVEITHVRAALEQRERVAITVVLDDPTSEVLVSVQQSDV